MHVLGGRPASRVRYAHVVVPGGHFPLIKLAIIFPRLDLRSDLSRGIRETEMKKRWKKFPTERFPEQRNGNGPGGAFPEDLLN